MLRLLSLAYPRFRDRLRAFLQAPSLLGPPRGVALGIALLVLGFYLLLMSQ